MLALIMAFFFQLDVYYTIDSKPTYNQTESKLIKVTITNTSQDTVAVGQQLQIDYGFQNLTDCSMSEDTPVGFVLILPGKSESYYLNLDTWIREYLTEKSQLFDQGRFRSMLPNQPGKYSLQYCARVFRYKNFLSEERINPYKYTRKLKAIVNFEVVENKQEWDSQIQSIYEYINRITTWRDEKYSEAKEIRENDEKIELLSQVLSYCDSNPNSLITRRLLFYVVNTGLYRVDSNLERRAFSIMKNSGFFDDQAMMTYFKDRFSNVTEPSVNQGIMIRKYIIELPE